MKVHRVTKRITNFLPNGRSYVVAGKKQTRQCHWVNDELPS